ncbi:MAG: peptide-methionine (S)-S-oxide reductase MsrA [Candidatus Delongbacteria bacterium]|nr:peptide-methionine (S)-S-oxide reductase MsrA [Candidatus Cloacimonadota bacterium]MCB9472359.1 peptide-methionine (S)-S-oxide reductase MsrA [Candidatus Delongbacteria bacterium]
MSTPGTESIFFGAGCFWCTEAAFALVPGVSAVTVGYQGGSTPDPSYHQVCSGSSGHAEVARVDYDPSGTNLDQLFDVFWTVHDPTTLNRQGADVGTQYRSVIFCSTDEQLSAAKASRERKQQELADPIVTEILRAPVFHPAEADHQDYFLNNPDAGYCRMVIAPKVKKVQKLLDH